MARGLYGGISSVKKLNKLYAGIDGVKKLKQLYVGIDGVPKLLFSADPSKVDKSLVSSLTNAKRYFATASIGNYALIAGGRNDSSYLSDVEAYDTTLAKTTRTSLPYGRAYHAGSHVGSFALFAGGRDSNSVQPQVDSYNDSLVKGTPTNLSMSRDQLRATWNPKFAIFGGIYTAGTVDAYNSSLTRSYNGSGMTPKAIYAGASVGDYGLFAGGQTRYGSSDGYDLDVVEVFKDTLTKTVCSKGLSEVKENLFGASNKDFAIFAGGNNVVTYSTNLRSVDFYDSSLTRRAPATLEAGGTDSTGICGVSTDEYAFFGSRYGSDPSAVEYFDRSMLRFRTDNLTQDKQFVGGAANPKYVFYAGGELISTKQVSNSVDAYEIAS